jgi:hypothetical protein
MLLFVGGLTHSRTGYIREWVGTDIIEIMLEDLEEEEGYESSELSDLNSSDIEEIKIED